MAAISQEQFAKFTSEMMEQMVKMMDERIGGITKKDEEKENRTGKYYKLEQKGFSRLMKFSEGEELFKDWAFDLKTAIKVQSEKWKRL